MAKKEINTVSKNQNYKNIGLVSIILPNYNHASYLKKRLDCIIHQTYEHFELIILDDASTDKSLRFLEAYKNHPKVSHYEINQKNTGSPFQQWQKGLQRAKGDYIWIAESDDCCDLNFLQSQIDFMKQHQLDVAVAQTYAINNLDEIKNEVQHPIFNKTDILKMDLDAFLYCPILNASTCLFKSNLAKSAGFFSSFNIIGDRVFYFEAFHKHKIGLNRATRSYFRKDNMGISALNSKNFSYLKAYYYEHQKFAKQALLNGSIDKNLYRTYVKRFFNRINNRMTKVEKLKLEYLCLRIRFKLEKVLK